MEQTRKQRMDALAQMLLKEYGVVEDEPYVYSNPLIWKGTQIETGDKGIVLIFISRTSDTAKKAAGLSPRTEVARCPTCKRPY